MDSALIVTNCSWNISNYRPWLPETLTDLKYNVHLATPDKKYLRGQEFEKFSHHRIHIKSQSLSLISNMRTFWSIFFLILHLKPKIILCFTTKVNFFVVLAAYLLNYKVIVTVSGFGIIYSAHTKYNNILRVLYTYILSKASIVIVQNKRDLRYLKGLRKFKNTQVISTLGSGVNLEKFKPSNTSSNNIKIFLYIGRCHQEKGINSFISAAQIFEANKHTQFKALIFSTNENEKKKLSELDTQHWPSNVELLTFKANISPLLRQAYFLVIPSDMREGVPKVFLEACALGTPTIMSKNIFTSLGMDSRHFTNEILYLDKKNISNTIKSAAKLSLPDYERISKNCSTLAIKYFDQNFVRESYTKAIVSLV